MRLEHGQVLEKNVSRVHILWMNLILVDSNALLVPYAKVDPV